MESVAGLLVAADPRTAPLAVRVTGRASLGTAVPAPTQSMPVARPTDAAIASSGPRIALTDPADIAPWLTDWRGRWTGASAAILQPESTGQVATLMALAARHHVALVPQGGNSSMVGGATPPADGSALYRSLARMNHIRALEPVMPWPRPG